MCVYKSKLSSLTFPSFLHPFHPVQITEFQENLQIKMPINAAFHFLMHVSTIIY